MEDPPHSESFSIPQVHGAGDSKLPRAAERKEKQPRSDDQGSNKAPGGDGSSQRQELTRGSSSGKFLKEHDAERNAPETITNEAVVPPVEAHVDEVSPEQGNNLSF